MGKQFFDKIDFFSLIYKHINLILDNFTKYLC
jgi:hypothetical protein